MSCPHFASLSWLLPTLTSVSVLCVSLNAAAVAQQFQVSDPGAESGYAVYMLSRGRGVPEEARAVFKKARAILESAQERGIPLRHKIVRIGIEGEARLCVVFANADQGRQIMAEIEKLARDIDLVSVKHEACD